MFNCLASKMTAPALSYKQGLGSGESGDSLSSRAGSVKSRFIWIRKFEILILFQNVSAQHYDVYIVAGGSPVQLRWRIWEAQFMMVLEVGKIKLITSYTWHNFWH